MENEKILEKLRTYTYEGFKIYTGFDSYIEGKAFADRNGALVEIGFLDGNDNPVEDNTAQLIANHQYFFADGGPGYKIVHSSNEGFKELVALWLKRTDEIQDKSIEEKYLSDSDELIPEDGVFVLRDGEIEKVTSRERVRYFHHMKVYELAVKVHN